MQREAVVHRIIEQQAAGSGDRLALLHRDERATYRDLNHRANMMARHLFGAGLRRGAHVIVTMPAGIDAAALLLAVLKCGSAYTWQPSGDTGSRSEIVVAAPASDVAAGHDVLDVSGARQQPTRPSPNLPILARPGDIACRLSRSEGAWDLPIAHATIAALRPSAWPAWREPGAFDLWTALMAGETVSLDAAPALLTAA